MRMMNNKTDIDPSLLFTDNILTTEAVAGRTNTLETQSLFHIFYVLLNNIVRFLF